MDTQGANLELPHSFCRKLRLIFYSVMVVAMLLAKLSRPCQAKLNNWHNQTKLTVIEIRVVFLTNPESLNLNFSPRHTDCVKLMIYKFQKICDMLQFSLYKIPISSNSHIVCTHVIGLSALIVTTIVIRKKQAHICQDGKHMTLMLIAFPKPWKNRAIIQSRSY